jgi:hypothetical protein
MKKNYFLVHKTMVEMTGKRIILFIKSIDRIHVNNLLMDED